MAAEDTAPGMRDLPHELDFLGDDAVESKAKWLMARGCPGEKTGQPSGKAGRHRQRKSQGRELSVRHSLFGEPRAPPALTGLLCFSGQSGVDGAGAVLPLGRRGRVHLPPLTPHHPADLLLQPRRQGVGRQLRGVPHARLR